MTDQPELSEAFLERLRKRAGDPARRTDHRPSQFEAGIATLDLGQLFGQLRRAGRDLGRMVQANRAGTADPESTAKADEIARAMQTPIDTALPAPASAATLDHAETRLGFALPIAARQVYAEVADGGFGPSTGFLSIDAVVERYRAVSEEVPRTQRWPDRLLPLVDGNPVLDCIDASSSAGRIVSWDPDGLPERAGDKTWQRSFREEAPSLEAWLEAWLVARGPEDRMTDVMRQARIDSVRQSRAYFAAMTPEERASYGLPEVGWERQIGAGLGLDEDEDIH
ncbi:MAG: SMI1/KNR4 family protein [Chloroflexota bacterium]